MDLLRHARDAALEGRIPEAIDLGHRAIAAATNKADPDTELLARQQLTEMLLTLGQGVPAHRNAAAAVDLLRPQHAADTRVRVMAGYAYAASFVGDGQTALRASAAARDEAQHSGSSALQALALNYFGVASMWDCRWRTCRQAFESSRALFPGNARPIVNAAFSNVLRTTVEATLEGAQACERSVREGEFLRAFEQALDVNLREALGVIDANTEITRQFFVAVTSSWQRRHTEAREAEESFTAVLDASPMLQWMHPYLHFSRCERAFAQGQYRLAVEHATAMIRRSDQQGCEQTHWIGRLLRARCLSTIDEHAAAAADWRYLWMRATRRHNEWGQPVAVRPAFNADPTQEMQASWMKRFRFTRAEVEIVRLLLQGNRPQEIARSRGTSYGTVRSQLACIYDKSGYRSQAQLVAGLSRGE